jgi:lipopolysaccharide transport system ATP-binding protein
VRDVAIRVENLGKMYRIGAARERHDTLRDALVHGARALLRRDGQSPEDNAIWALRGVSFELGRGEVVGIIGRNGAGKSTLLKILSRITEPTVGRADLYGRVGSLLEVGTGFHPELTGRENIYLSGAILGMKKVEIDRRFDEIVAFAEIERFLDTPVKRYSSGMYVRLAFAVAAHLEPEILLVDEVLAVGDVAFQKKCLGKMGDVAREGRTVLFVSHNMGAIQRLCPESLLLQEGQLVTLDRSTDVISQYFSVTEDAVPPGEWIDLSFLPRQGSGQAQFMATRYTSHSEETGGMLYSEGPAEFVVEVTSDADRLARGMSVTIYGENGVNLVNADTTSLGENVKLEAGRNLFKFRISPLHLNSGSYHVGFWMADLNGSTLDYIVSGLAIHVVAPAHAELGIKNQYAGTVTCPFEFSYLNSQHDKQGHCTVAEDRLGWQR